MLLTFGIERMSVVLGLSLGLFLSKAEMTEVNIAERL
jgi:hypothetical protein